jgi:hypothetical protein
MQTLAEKLPKDMIKTPSQEEKSDEKVLKSDEIGF